MITSRHNPTIQAVCSLRRNRPACSFLLEGPRLLEEALSAGVHLDVLLLSPRAVGPVFDRARSTAETVVEVTEDILSYAADSQQPQGIVAIGRVPVRPLDDNAARRGRLLLLDEVRDPGNLGTVVRSAWASGTSGILLVGHCVDEWNPKVVRAAAGASFRLPTLAFEDRASAGSWLREHGQRAVMAVAGGRLSCFEADLRAPLTLVLGSEAHGVHPDTAAFCEDSVYIPMVEGCESLNLAASAAILCYLALDRSRTEPSVDQCLS